MRSAVNFYKHHLGDYDGATMHLTWDEDMAYTRLLRVYYRDEKPIPLDPRLVYRLTRSQSKAQRQAIDEVLREYFEKQSDGWHNKRADEEIGQTRAFTEHQRQAGKSSAVQRRLNGGYSSVPTKLQPKANGGSIPVEPSRLQTPDSTIHHPHPLSSPEGVGVKKRLRTADEIEADEDRRIAAGEVIPRA